MTAHFDAAALYWQAVYDDPRLQGLIYRVRQEAVLARVDAFPPQGSRVLEIGCGAGLLTAELARRGYAVQAIDVSEAMVDLTARRLAAEGFAEQVQARTADVGALPFAAGDFSLVIAVGVLPWLDRPARALGEMARVLRMGGGLILTADNRARLNTLIDPRASMPLAAVKRLRRRLRPSQPAGAISRLHYPSHVNSLVRAAGFQIDASSTVGFGPFTFWSRELLADPAAIALHERLQRLADSGVPLLRSAGWHYLLSAHKTG